MASKTTYPQLDDVIVAWPECKECGRAWVLRRAIIPKGWIWQSDCKHKNAEVRLVGQGREVPSDGA